MFELRLRDRTDTIATKIRLLQDAYSAGNLDLAMSLAVSIKDTLSFERQGVGSEEQPQIGAGDFVRVADLPVAWANWAKGWSFCKPLTLFETIGVERRREPVDVTIALRADQTTDLQREVRVAKVDQVSGSLQEVPFQLYGETRHGTDRHCHLVLLADVALHQQTSYLLFYGNPHAELPQYSTDLQTRGEGYGLEIENHHFIARLSQQMGQLERLTYKRQHGLELFAGGKGHGEPPTIDWAHDYVDPDHFQKLRIKNWHACPNFEVVKGPLCIRVRRWGFPYSPIHPVFTPSRMHVDQTYIFYAGQPCFYKEGRMEAVQDMWIEAMRDDEWVFSGYSFNETLWIDRQGKLHEGSISAEQANELWGVGFFHRQSGDAFVALRLDHSAKGFDSLQHDGVPTLHYDGHGQLWSRYPAQRAQLTAGTSFQQRNAYVVSPYSSGDGAGLEQLRHRMLNPVTVRAEQPRISRPTAVGALARWGETADSAPLKPKIWDALRSVRDEQLYKIDANVVDMGLVYDVRVRNGTVTVVVTMPHAGRPKFEFLVTQGGGRVEEGIRERLLKIDGVRDVVVEPSWNPAWSIARLTDAGRRALGLPV